MQYIFFFGLKTDAIAIDNFTLNTLLLFSSCLYVYIFPSFSGTTAFHILRSVHYMQKHLFTNVFLNNLINNKKMQYLLDLVLDGVVCILSLYTDYHMSTIVRNYNVCNVWFKQNPVLCIKL